MYCWVGIEEWECIGIWKSTEGWECIAGKVLKDGFKGRGEWLTIFTCEWS